MTDDRYGRDVLADFSRRTRATPARQREVAAGLVVEHVESGFCGAVTGVAPHTVELEDRLGVLRTFPLGQGFLLEGQPVTLIRPRAAPVGAARSASGSRAVPDLRARVARRSRILVEGRHDAELVEKIWGHDLRVDGVVVEALGGVDELEAVIDSMHPSSSARLGVLVDHLVPGSKESRIADAAMRGVHREHVLVVGHPFVDVWQAVKPDRLGLRAWPEVPRSTEWKVGICAALGWPHEDQTDIADAWGRILDRVSIFSDLEPALLGSVERLIDFVTEPPE